jgi:hypothetical protein
MPKPMDTPPIYQNPFMAPNGLSGIHLNSYMTDTGDLKGPAFATKQSLQQKLITPPGIAATIAFNAKGQVVTIHIGEGAPTIMLIDPTTLHTLATASLPLRPANPNPGTISFAGGYFYLDQDSNVVCVVTSTDPKLVQEIRIYSTKNDKLALVRTHDLQSSINASDDILNSVLPDSSGNIWYITQKGVVGYVDKETGVPAVPVRLNEPISKSFASDGEGGVYVVTDYALYGFRSGGRPPGPIVFWRTTYDRGSGPDPKPGQNQVGCGTTPTCFDDFVGNRFVTITDNATQMHVNVYLRESGKQVIQQEVFIAHPKENACENSLIAVNRSIIVENNWGNKHIQSTAGPLTTTPGVNRVDFDYAGSRAPAISKVAWANDSTAVPSVVSQLSTGDGMIYTYAKDPTGWYWAALDFETGKLLKRSDYVTFADAGDVEEPCNNWYAGLTVGPDGAAYLSVFGGLTVWRPA